MNRYTYPKDIQRTLNQLNDAEITFFEMHPEMRCYMRDVQPEEFDAQEYRKLMEPESNFVSCRGCARFVFVLRSPEHKQRLHFFAPNMIEHVGQLEQLYKGLSLLVKADTEKEFEGISSVMFKPDDDEGYPQPFVYRTVKV